MKFSIKLTLFLLAVTLLNACLTNTPTNKAGIKPKAFNKTIDGKQVYLETITNANGLEISLTNYGARVVSLLVPDKNGEFEDIVLGFDNIEDYIDGNEPYFGAVIGRYGNRISKGEFVLNGQTYSLAANNGMNHLHGGLKGYNAVVWEMNKINEQTLEFSYLSKDMEEGYPGNLEIKMVYKLSDNNAITITFEATTDKSTIVNLTNHILFNLHGAGHESVNNHVLYLNADYYTPTDAGLIPTGDINPVAGTPMDFTSPTIIGKRLDEDFEALKLANGYDHNFVLNQPEPKQIIIAASVYDPISGRYMEVHTDQAAIHFYGGNHLNGSTIGKQNKSYKYRSAFCVQSQQYPDSPNKPNFPSTILNPGETYAHTCIYKFGIK